MEEAEESQVSGEISYNSEIDSELPVMKRLPNAEHDFSIAKRYLQKMGRNQESVWEILSNALQAVGDYKGEITVDKFHELIRRIMKAANVSEMASFRECYSEPLGLRFCSENVRFLKSLRYRWDPEERLPDPNVFPDPKTHEKLQLLLEAGVGLTDYEHYNILLALKCLAEQTAVTKARFWGKIYGLKKNYYIIEVDPDPEMVKTAQQAEKMMGALTKSNEAAEKARIDLKEKEQDVTDWLRGMKEELAAIKEGVVMALGELGAASTEPPGLLASYKMPLLPKPDSFEETIVPPEPLGEGANWKQYYVTNELHDTFSLLPEVSPSQITVARTIKKFFTGDLDHEFDSFPPFPGKERHLLRAQIARITASTTICPAGFYISQIGEEEIIDEEIPGGYMENPDYHPPPLKWLMHSERKYWMHCRHYILPQGRTKYWKSQEDYGEYEGGSILTDEELRGRFAPPPLTLISRDDSPDVEKCWSLRRAYRTMGKNQIAIVRSNVWPGAFCVNRGYLFENVYIGWGLKALSQYYFPPALPDVWWEYDQGPDIMEMRDPTPEEEEAWRLAHLPKPPPEYAGEGGEGGEDLGPTDEDDDVD